jgi:hypothetical protein
MESIRERWIGDGAERLKELSESLRQIADERDY